MKMNNNRTAQRIRIEVTATAIRETEKAYQAEVKYWTKFDAPVKTAKMWVPKSCCAAENGTITSIDKFILDKWEEEHRNLIGTHSSYAAKKTHIEWNLAWKEELIQRDKDEKAAYKKHIDDLVAKYLPIVKESSNKMLSKLGTVARVYGYLWKEQGFDTALCDEFIAWGEAINKKYGECENYNECLETAKNMKKEDYRFIPGFVHNIWVFGNFHAYLHGRNGDFLEIHADLERKHFKKEAALVNEYKAFIERLHNAGVGL